MVKIFFFFRLLLLHRFNGINNDRWSFEHLFNFTEWMEIKWRDCFAVLVRELFSGVWNFENEFCLNLKSIFSKIVFLQLHQANLVAFLITFIAYKAMSVLHRSPSIISLTLWAPQFNRPLFMLCSCCDVCSRPYKLTAAAAAAGIAWQATNHRELTSIHQFDRYCVIDCFQFFANGHYYNKMALHTTIVR